jgi:hypothetical protein
VTAPVFSHELLDRTSAWIASHQRPDGGIGWFEDGRLDPWNNVQCAMALTVMGHLDEARTAFRALVDLQLEDGAWPSLATMNRVIDRTRDTNHAAYLASGLWHYHLATGDIDLVAELWPTLERALGFVTRHQDPDGVLCWGVDGEGNVWHAPLIAGSASAHGSLRCAVRVAELLGNDRPEWSTAADRLHSLLLADHPRFHNHDMPTPAGHFGMDWYYPVLGGAVRGEAGRARLATDRAFWIHEGLGCRCVADRPWYTVAETCELVMAADALGLDDLARDLFAWAQIRREDDGGYWTGTVIVEDDLVIWPEERPTWTAATVILAADVLRGDSPTSSFFRDLSVEE